VALFALLGLGLQQAKADIMSTLNVGNSDLTGNGFNPPYGTVTIGLSGQVATITFKAATGYEFGDGQSVDVNVNSGDFTPGGLLPAGGSFDTSGPPVDGFGDFNLQVDYANFSVGFTLISFTVTNNDLSNLWGSATDVLAFNGHTQNGGPFDAAAHVRSTVNNPQGLTGKAAESGGFTNVPDSGTTAMLLGLSLSGLGFVRRLVKR
jgi:protein with PEP-CTERM/exosortase system signal